MGIKRDDDRRSRTANRNATAAPAPATRETDLDRFDRDQDMGGSAWSGASGRGGVCHEASGRATNAYAASNRGYGSERADAGERFHGYGPEYRHEGDFPGDRRHVNEEPPGGPASDRRFGHEVVGARRSGAYTSAAARREDCGFIEEQGFGHVPGQRWSGGYGGDRDDASSGPPSGRGFTGNDFGVPASADDRDRESDRMRAFEPRPERHFGTPVDRGGRMGPSEEWERAAEHRGPHWGKGPKGYVRSDVRTYEDVCEAIAHDGQVDASDVDVRVDKSVVTLVGTVADRHDKRALERLVERVRGVHEVRNELRLARTVYGDARAARTDAPDSRESQASQDRDDDDHEGEDAWRDASGRRHGKGAPA